MSRTIKLDDFHKMKATSVIRPDNGPSDIVRAIFKVREPNYVPKHVNHRSSMSPVIFTGEFKYGDLELLERDPKVVSVSVSEPLQSAG